MIAVAPALGYIPTSFCEVSICPLVWVAIVLSTAKAMREPVTRIKQIVFPHLFIYGLPQGTSEHINYHYEMSSMWK